VVGCWQHQACGQEALGNIECLQSENAWVLRFAQDDKDEECPRQIGNYLLGWTSMVSPGWSLASLPRCQKMERAVTAKPR
jgi:hypothetical protein